MFHDYNLVELRFYHCFSIIRVDLLKFEVLVTLRFTFRVAVG